MRKLEELFHYNGKMKIWITKNTKKPGDEIVHMERMISFDEVKPYDLSDDEWKVILPFIKEIHIGVAGDFKNIRTENCWFDLHVLCEDRISDIIAESEHYYILRSFEDASIYRKPDSKHITCVGDFYGDPEDAYIDPEEKFCITIGCGIIKYNLCEPFEGYSYNRNTPQWIEIGREGDIEWCDHIDEVTEDYIAVSIEGEEKRKYDINTLELIETT